MFQPILPQPACHESRPIDPLAPARGILLAVALSVPVWIAIGAAVWAVSR